MQALLWYLVKCKACGQEIAKGVKKCPHCGKDQGSFFGKHKIITGLAIIIILVVLINAMGGSKDDSSAAKTNTNKSSTTASSNSSKANTSTPAAPKVKTYSDGTYLVNKDITSGLYRVTLNDTGMKIGYVERAKDVNMETDSIIANILLSGNGFVEIKSTDKAVKLQGVTIEPIKLTDLKPNIKNEASDGIYLIGYDLAPGTYKVEVTDTTTKMGYVERSKSVAMGTEDMIANEIQQGTGYVKIEKGDFAVRLQGVKITLQK